jgi:hypothetical protein
LTVVQWERYLGAWPKEDAVKHLRWTLVLAAAVALSAVPVAAAKPPGGAVISPVHHAAGLSGGELLGQFWAVQLENPADAFLGDCFSLGKKGKIAVPAPDENFAAECTVKPGTPVYIAPGGECSDVEDPPFFGEDEAAQRACVLAFDREFFLAASVSVDGAEPVDFLTPRFEVISPQMTVQLAPDNFLGVPPQTATFVAHAWAFVVRGLTPGEHVITALVETADGAVTEARFIINVVPPGRAR